MIVTPVNWYQAPTSLKAMIDRLVAPTEAIPIHPQPTEKRSAKRKSSNSKVGPIRATLPDGILL